MGVTPVDSVEGERPGMYTVIIESDDMDEDRWYWSGHANNSVDALMRAGEARGGLFRLNDETKRYDRMKP